MSMSTPQRAADVAAGVSVAAAGTSWVSQANEVVSLVGSVIAIMAGIGAIIVHFLNVRDKLKDKS